MNPSPVASSFNPPTIGCRRARARARDRHHAPAVLAATVLVGLTLASSPKAAQAQTAGRSPAVAQAGTVIDFGKREFESNCASCHGTDGKGRGPVAGFLTRNPPDLTTLARQNQGILPMNRLYESIEGGGTPLHGGREMPVWGRAYRIQDAEYQGEGPYDAEALVRARILSLLEYLNRLQAR